jgi:hypothetical protein
MSEEEFERRFDYGKPDPLSYPHLLVEARRAREAETLLGEQIVFMSKDHSAENAALRERAEKAWDEGQIAGSHNTPGYRENRELRDLLEQAEARAEKLLKYAQHLDDCKKREWMAPHARPCDCGSCVCTCGLDAALAQPVPEKEGRKK